MKISIITVCKNSEQTIEKTIKSVICQTYKDIEYIIIDGDSQDQTKEIIARYADFITKIISEPDAGIYAAMNNGIRLATGTFINFLNSDDYLYDANVIQDVVNFISENPESEFVYGDAHIRPDPVLSKEPSFSKSPLPAEVPNAIIYGSLFLQGSIFFKADLFSQLGFFNENYKISADYEWFTRLVDKNIKLCYYPKVIFSYSQGGLSSDIKATVTEMFKIQNQVPLFQTDHWLKIRLLKLQEGIIELKDFVYQNQKISEERRILIEARDQKIAEMESENTVMNSEIADLKNKIKEMETSNIWLLEAILFRLKKGLKVRLNSLRFIKICKLI